MQYQVKVEGESLDVEILHERGSWRARVGEGPWQEVDLRTPEPGVLSLLIADRSLEASLAGGERGDWQVDIYGQTYACEVVDPRRAALELGGGGGEGLLTTSMPGKVVRLLCAEGDEVRQGQPLLVLEAMKMENEIMAPCDGVVKEVWIQPGEALDAGARLLHIEEEEA